MTIKNPWKCEAEVTFSLNHTKTTFTQKLTVIYESAKALRPAIENMLKAQYGDVTIHTVHAGSPEPVLHVEMHKEDVIDTGRWYEQMCEYSEEEFQIIDITPCLDENNELYYTITYITERKHR